MRERAGELERLNVRVLAVTFESRQRIAEFEQREPLPFPVLRDPGRVAYKAFGFERRSSATIWGPPTLMYYVRRMLAGRLPEVTRGDPYQLGGDVIVGPDRRGGWVYRSEHPADRPSVASILSVIHRDTGTLERH